MTTSHETPAKPSEWVFHVHKATTQDATWHFTAEDRFGAPVLVEWQKADIQSPKLAGFKKDISEMAAQILAPIEVDFLRKYPEAVSQEVFLKSCAPFFEMGLDAVPWGEVEERIRSSIQQFYSMDLSSFGPAVIRPLLDDIYFFATVKEAATKKTLGFIMTAITPALPFGNIKVINIAVLPEEQKRGLDRLLMSSIFKIVPETRRLFLFARPTNYNALSNYFLLGFKQDLQPSMDPNHKVNLDYLVLLEYQAEESDILQKNSENLNLSN